KFRFSFERISGVILSRFTATEKYLRFELKPFSSFFPMDSQACSRKAVYSSCWACTVKEVKNNRIRMGVFIKTIFCIYYNRRKNSYLPNYKLERTKRVLYPNP